MSLLEQIAEAKNRIAELEDRLAGERKVLQDLVTQLEASLTELRQTAGMAAPRTATGRKPRSLESRFMVTLTRVKNQNPYSSHLQTLLMQQAERSASKMGVAVPDSVREWINKQKPLPMPASAEAKRKGGK